MHEPVSWLVFLTRITTGYPFDISMKLAMKKQQLAILAMFAMTAFAANSLLCRLALKHAQIDAASFTTIRVLSGAAILWLILRFQGGALIMRRVIGLPHLHCSYIWPPFLLPTLFCRQAQALFCCSARCS
jgi:hypothetical protein